MSAQRRELSTWAEIAEYLRVSVRQAQNYESTEGMPVHRFPGARRRVLAYTDELDRWKSDRLEPSGAAVPISHSEAPAESGLPQGHTVDQFSRPSSSPRVYITISFAIVLVAIGAFAVFSRLPGRSPARSEVHADTLYVYDTRGTEVWSYRFPTRIDERAYIDTSVRTGRTVFADLDGDATTEVLFTYYPVDYGRNGAELYCFSSTGKLRWKYKPGQRVVRDRSGEDYFPPYYINSVRVIPHSAKGGRARISVSANHSVQAPDQLTVLDANGKTVGEYWHPGHLLHVDFADLDHDGNSEILLGGVNNGQHSATLVVFDPNNVRGTATDLTDDRFGLTGFETGTERAVVLFPRSCVARKAAEFKPFNRVVSLRVTPERIYVVVGESTAETEAKAIIYELDYGLNVISASASLEFQYAHRDLHSLGLVDHVFDAVHPDELTSQVVCIKGCSGGTQLDRARLAQLLTR